VTATRPPAMCLTDALTVVTADTDPAQSYGQALRAIGARLASIVDLEPGTTAVTVGRGGRKLLEGAITVWGPLPTSAVIPDVAGPLVLRWITEKPPADLPLVVFDPHLTDGLTARALLSDLRCDCQAPAAVFTARARSRGRAVLRRAHPRVEVITPATIRLTDHARAEGERR
jgi:hypothetical protein